MIFRPSKRTLFILVMIYAVVMTVMLLFLTGCNTAVQYRVIEGPASLEIGGSLWTPPVAVTLEESGRYETGLYDGRNAE
jgi:hypothetical protein